MLGRADFATSSVAPMAEAALDGEERLTGLHLFPWIGLRCRCLRRLRSLVLSRATLFHGGLSEGIPAAVVQSTSSLTARTLGGETLTAAESGYADAQHDCQWIPYDQS